jgi:ribonuclease HI
MEPLVYIHADESCLGVQFTDRDSPGGAGGLVEHWTAAEWHRRDYWASEPATTNNRMALLSAELPLRLLQRPCRVLFTSDSNYLVRGMREWVYGWASRGWRRRTGAVENEDLWRRLVDAARPHRIDWRWVRGHAGHPRNEYANHLATRAAREQTSSAGFVPSGYLEWLEKEREKGRYLDVYEFAAPEDDAFDPVRRL